MKETDWTKLSSIAEIISSVAILITLVYLAIQAQQTNVTLLANSRQTQMTADIDLIAAMISNPVTNANAIKAMSELSFAEQEQIGNMMAGFVRTREFAWLQYENGIMDKATSDSYMGTLIRFINVGEVPRFYWELFSAEMNPEFVNYVNELDDNRQ